MAYWWVSQQEMFKDQRLGHYLWAPIENEARQSYFHWRNMAEVRPGDVIFSYVDGAFPAVGVARSEPYEADRPKGLNFPEGTAKGRKIDVNYRDFNPPSGLKPVVEMLAPHLPVKRSPLRHDGSDYDGYLFALDGRAGRLLLDYLGSPVGQAGDESISAIVLTSGSDMSTRRALAASRMGLGDFRKGVFKIWDGKCAITRSSQPELLKARHIKPWRDSNNEERLDPYNGLLLSPLYDAAFTTGLISFDFSGRLVLSSAVSNFQWDLLGLRRTAWLEHLKEEHQPYLAYHRQQVFLGRGSEDSGIEKMAPFAIS
jgi:putative restriction endonuclease